VDFKISFTDKPISAWGGMVIMQRLIERSGILSILSKLDLPAQGSNRGYSPLQLIQAFWVSVWCGANRFMHLEVLRMDSTLQKLFGWKRMAGHKAFQRYFDKFGVSGNYRIFSGLYQWFFEQLHFDNYSLDVDSTVLTRYGNQEGSAKGHNAKKPGRKSHHPLIAIVAECRMVANFWLRSGGTSPINNFEAFLSETLDNLKAKTIGLLRGDSGFYCKEVFDLLEGRSIHYIIAAQMYPIIQRHIASVQNWMPVGEGVEIASVNYQSPLWDRERRLVIVRQNIEERPNATGKTLELFKNDDAMKRYRFNAVVTNLSLPAKEVWAMYRNRADAENRIKELKEDFALQSFCMNSFYATETALNWVMMAYNLMSLFRIAILKAPVQPQLKTLRYKIFAVPAYITKNGNQRILNMAIVMERRKWFEGLFSKMDDFEMPFKI
jgi:hypothetical protein